MFHIIVNPASCSGHGKQEWLKMEPIFARSGKQYQVHYCSPEHPLQEICGELTDPNSAGFTGATDHCSLVILGGDGTMNAAVNGIRDFARTRVGFIQIGSGNDLSKDMDLPASQETLITQILRDEVVRTNDIGKLTYHNQYDVIDPFTGEIQVGLVCEDDKSRLFNISAGFGFDAACCEMAEMSHAKKFLNKIHLGKLVYLVTAIRLILTHPMDGLEIILESENDTRTLSFGRTLFAVCMNHKYEGGGFKFCPRADASDGQLDLCIAADLKRLSFFRIFPTAYSGNHFRFKGISEERAVKVSMRSEFPLWVHTDGEVRCRSTHISVELLPKKLNLLM